MLLLSKHFVLFQLSPILQVPCVDDLTHKGHTQPFTEEGTRYSQPMQEISKTIQDPSNHCHVFQLFVWKTLQGLCDLGPRSLLLTPPCSILLPLQAPGPDQAWATLQRRKQNRTSQWKGSGFGDQALRVSESDRHLVLALWPWPNSLVSVPPFPHL